MTFNDLLKRLTFFKVTKWGTTGSSEDEIDDERHPVTTLDEANVVVSKHAKTALDDFDDFFGVSSPAQKNSHALLLDLDIPAWLVSSSTPGHSHLYVDCHIPEDEYYDLLDALAHAGVIQKNFAKYAKVRGGSTLRLPWVKKDGSVDEEWQ